MVVNRGLGSNVPNSSLISSAVATVGGTGAALATTVGGTALLASIGIGASFIPLIGPIVGGIALAISALGIGNGCGPTCTASTSIVNDIEPYMKQNVQAAADQAQANGGCLTSAEVQVLIKNFNDLWNYVTSNCQKVGGVGGSQCISDRQRGGKWDWFSYYLDPINAYPVCSGVSGESLVSGSFPWLLVAGIVAIGLWAFSEGD